MQTDTSTEVRSTPSLNDGPNSKWQPALVVFSGGTAFNGLCGPLHDHFTSRVAHVLPVSDDGGSTAEIVRVLGGPAVGDIRSRCLRLSDESTEEAMAVKNLLGHRLPRNSIEAKAEWYSIVEGEHRLWGGVSEPYKHTIRAFLTHFNTQILCKTDTQRFRHANGSVGNFFFAGARTFFGSLEAAIFLYARVSRIPDQCKVLPAVSTNDHLTLAAELEDGTVIHGQSAISHPTDPAHGTVVTKKGGAADVPLSSPVRRILYMSSAGSHREHEIFPHGNAEVLKCLAETAAVVYGCGSLYTSICPSLIPAGIGEAIADIQRPKIALLNGSLDRETTGMTATDVVRAITAALNRTHSSRERGALEHPPSAYITTLLAPTDGEIAIDWEELQALGISVVMVESARDGDNSVLFCPKALVAALREQVSRRA